MKKKTHIALFFGGAANGRVSGGNSLYTVCEILVVPIATEIIRLNHCRIPYCRNFIFSYSI